MRSGRLIDSIGLCAISGFLLFGHGRNLNIKKNL